VEISAMDLCVSWPLSPLPKIQTKVEQTEVGARERAANESVICVIKIEAALIETEKLGSAPF
jgi:hypothetical protein